MNFFYYTVCFFFLFLFFFPFSVFSGVSGVLAVQKPLQFKARTINVYPHDRKAFTQGLAFLDGFIYEGTGVRGSSFLMKKELETGD
ncbi:MAG: glutaminyl-peptide cyclotransferase, partial [Nitrospinota bacterium]